MFVAGREEENFVDVRCRRRGGELESWRDAIGERAKAHREKEEKKMKPKSFILFILLWHGPYWAIDNIFS